MQAQGNQLPVNHPQHSLQACMFLALRALSIKTTQLKAFQGTAERTGKVVAAEYLDRAGKLGTQ
jgi:hypothetical protein